MDGSWTFHYGPSGFLPIEGLPSRFQQAHRPCFDAFSIFRFGTHTSRSPPSCASLVCISSSACLRFMLSPTPMVGRLYSTSLSTLRKHAPLFVSLCTHPLLSWFLCLLFTRSVHLSPSLVCVAIVLVLAPPNFCVLGWLACHRVDCRWHMDFFLGGVNTWWCTTMGQTNQTRNKSTVVLRHGATTAATAAFLRRRCGQDRERRRMDGKDDVGKETEAVKDERMPSAPAVFADVRPGKKSWERAKAPVFRAVGSVATSEQQAHVEQTRDTRGHWRERKRRRDGWTERRGKRIDGVHVLTCGSGRRTDRRDPSTHGRECMQDHHRHGPTNDRHHLDFLDPTRMERTTEDQVEMQELPREQDMFPWVDHHRPMEVRLDPYHHPTNILRLLRCQQQDTIRVHNPHRFLHHIRDTAARHRRPLGQHNQHPVLLSIRKGKHHLLDHHQALLDPHHMGNCQLMGRQPCLRPPTQDRHYQDRRRPSLLASKRNNNLLGLHIPQVQVQV